MEQAKPEFTDRYQATGRAYPNPWTGCGSACEGMGLYPLKFDEWLEMRPNQPAGCPQQDEDGSWQEFPPEDGWLFVYCPDCLGTGRKITGRIGHFLDITRTYYYQLWFPFWALYAETIKGYHPPVREHPLRRLVFWFRFMHGEQRNQRELLRR